jgi:peroxiredoxin
MRLAEKIERINQSFSRMMSQDDLHSLRKEIKKLAESGLAERSLKIGESIPECILPNERNEKIDIHSMLRNQPVIISFYRGQWCPYCNLELRAFQEALPEIKKLHAQLVAISPQTPDYSLSTQQRNELEFDLLSDVGNGVSRSFGLVFRLSGTMEELYRKYRMSLPRYNGDNSWELPVPGTFVVDKRGIIRGRFVNADYTQRADPGDVTAVLHKL